MSKLIINLEKFKVIEKEDVSKEEAYMWCFGVVIDSNTITNGNYIIPKKCGHGNIGKSFKTGQTRNIPKSVGYIESSITPIFSFAGVGVIILGWEEDNTPNKKVKKAYNDSIEILNNFIAERVESLNFDQISDTEIKELKSQLTKAIEKRFKSAVNWYNPFSWDPDDYIGLGQIIETIKGNEPLHVPITFNLKGDGAHYRITGELNYTP
ncbi:hypothetical protein JW964_19745 [candidate division KSB1 bacterium]|nr:hypothetical protein [candidate division KSB1 bacterium]